jgi:hypothetical protein
MRRSFQPGLELARYLAQSPPAQPLPRRTNLLAAVALPVASPFDDECFRREDESDDSDFYA